MVSLLSFVSVAADRFGGSSLPYECSKVCTTESPHIIAAAKDWIEICRGHKICQNDFIAPSSRSFRPTRLLKLESAEDAAGSQRKDLTKVQLVTTEHLHTQSEDSLEYVALSHCWGGADILKLLSTNINELKKRVPFSELPLNFQHAIHVTLGIGKQYLWIDSLCIIQEDQADWLVEAPRMGLVYANAVCTISATASETPSGGCFKPKKPFQNSCILRHQGEFSLVVRSLKQDTKILEDLFEEEVESAPLTKRGWTFQERYLSKRILNFCDGDVLFECNEMQASEYHIQGVPYAKRSNIRADGTLHSSALLQRLNMEDDPFTRETREERYQEPSTRPVSRPGKWRTRTITKVKPNHDYKTQPQKEAELDSLSALFGIRGAFQLVLRSSGKEPAEKMEFHQCWYEMIEKYSTRKLSWHTDKLMAVAGIAYFIQAYAGRTFLAGLWMSTLPFNLLWTREDPASAGPRPIRDLPAWSWASVDGVISHRLKVPLPRDDKGQSSAKSPEEQYRTTWQEIRFYIDDIDENSVESLSSHNGLIHNAALRLSCSLVPLDPEFKDGSLDFIPDIALEDDAAALSPAMKQTK